MQASSFGSLRGLASAGVMVFASLATLTVARATSNTVVISQVYSGGGQSSSAFQNDYIVLFNNGTAPIDVSTWSLQVEVAGPAGPAWEIVPLCGSIPHGRFYLVALAAGPGGAMLPPSDCSGAIDLPSVSGKIALVSGTTPLVGSCPLAAPGPVDFVGYGALVGCSEGSPAASPGPSTALFRGPTNPCTDTDSNAADFALATPNPMSTTSPGEGCNNAAPVVAPIPPQIVNELATLTVTPSASDPNGDPIAWGGSNLPTGSGVAPTTGVFTWTPGGNEAGTYSAVLLSAQDDLGGSGSASFDITVVDATTPNVDPIADQVVAEGGTRTVTASAADPDGDPLTFSSSPPHAWITQPPMTSEFVITPGFDVAGSGGASFPIAVEASDGSNVGSTTFTVHVVNWTTAANAPHAARSWTGVSVATGELSLVEGPDLCLGGPRSLCFGRYYASLLDREGVAAGTLGTNWTGTYDWKLVETPSEARVIDPCGRVYRFSSGPAGGWTLVEPLDAPYQLTDLGTEVALAHVRHRAFYILDRTSARLARIEDGRGNVHTLSYAGGLLSAVSDGLGRTLTFAYDGLGRVTSVTDGTRTATYGYSGANLVAFTDAESKTTIYQYDLAHPVQGLLTGIADASGTASLQYEHGPDGLVSQVDFGSGAGATFQRTLLSSGQVQTTVQWPDGGSHQYVHDGFDRLAQHTDPQSGVTSWSYDGQGRPTSLTRPSTIVPVTIAYDPVSGFPANLTLPDASQWQASYEVRNYVAGKFYLPSSAQAPDLGQISYMYDAVGNLTKITDQAGLEWTLAHNGFGQPLTIANPTLGVITNTYDAKGRILTMDDGISTTGFTHDALDRLVTITHPDASTQHFTWNGRNQLLTFTNEHSKTWAYVYRDNGQLESVTDPLSATTTIGYDTHGRPAQVMDAMLGITGLGYDPSWQLSSITDPTLRTVTYGHDRFGRLSDITDPGGETISFEYDADSRLTSTADPLSHTWSYGYDVRDRVTSVTNPLLQSTAYGYDAVGRLTSITRPLAPTTTYAYDLRGLLTAATTGPVSEGFAYTPLRQLETFTDGEGNDWTRGYDAIGRITSKTDPLLRSASFSYDTRHRLAGIVHPEGTSSFVHDAANRLTQRSHSDGTVHDYTYDDVGRLLTTEGVSRTYDALGRATEENGITYGYDAAGRLQTETYAVGHEVGHNFGVRGLLTETTDWLSGVTNFSYDAAGRLTMISRPNGTSAHYEYDAANRLLSLAELGPTDSLASVLMTRDALGRVTSATRGMPFQWSPEPVSGQFTYDAASQVDGFIYDGLGRLLANGARTYAWDGGSRADSIGEGTSVRRYASDGLDRVSGVQGSGTPEIVLVPPTSSLPPRVARVRQTPGGALSDQTHFVTTPSGLLLHSIDVSGPAPRPRYFHFDEYGNTAFQTNSNGSVVGSYAYSPTGDAVSQGEVQPYPAFTFRGRFGLTQESVTGLYRLGGSFYDARTATGPFAGPHARMRGSMASTPVFPAPTIPPLLDLDPSPTGAAHLGRNDGRLQILSVGGPTPASAGGIGEGASDVLAADGGPIGAAVAIPSLIKSRRSANETSDGGFLLLVSAGAPPASAGGIGEGASDVLAADGGPQAGAVAIPSLIKSRRFANETGDGGFHLLVSAGAPPASAGGIGEGASDVLAADGGPQAGAVAIPSLIKSRRSANGSAFVGRDDGFLQMVSAGTAPTQGSGISEIKGNDFIVTLGSLGQGIAAGSGGLGVWVDLLPTRAMPYIKTGGVLRTMPSSEWESWSPTFDRHYLTLQQQLQRAHRPASTLSNILKKVHDSAKNSISNMR